MEEKDYYTIEDIFKIDCEIQLKRAFKEWGVERTEEKIKSLYSAMPTLRDFMLKCYKELINDKNISL